MSQQEYKLGVFYTAGAYILWGHTLLENGDKEEVQFYENLIYNYSFHHGDISRSSIHDKSEII